MINEVIKDLKTVDEVNAAKGIVYTIYTYMPKAIDILESLKGLEVNDCKRDEVLKAFEDNKRNYIDARNSYNWNGSIDHDMQWYVVKVKGRKFIILSFHRYGDVRVNYTEEVVLNYDDIDGDDFYDAIIDNDMHDTVEVDGVAYNFQVSAMNEGVEVFAEGCNSFTIYPDGLTLEDIVKAIKEKVTKDEASN